MAELRVLYLRALYCNRCGEVYLDQYHQADYANCVVWRGRLARSCQGRLVTMTAGDEALVLAAFALGGWDAVASLGGKFSPPDERDGGQAVYRP